MMNIKGKGVERVASVLSELVGDGRQNLSLFVCVPPYEEC